MVREYMHIRTYLPVSRIVTFSEGSFDVDESLVKYKHREVVVLKKAVVSLLERNGQGEPLKREFVIVPGYVVRLKYRRAGVDIISEVEPIVNVEERKELEGVLRRERFGGKINFWS